MPELDLTLAQELRIANKEALEIRIANQTVWTRPSQYQEHSVYSTAPLVDYHAYDDLGVGSWLAGNFYTNGIPELYGWTIAGARIWVPLDAPQLVGLSGYIALFKVNDSLNNIVIGEWEANNGQEVLDRFDDNGTKTAFTNLQPGWNTIYFDQEWPMKHGNGFAIGYQIGDGRYYIHHNSSAGAVQSPDGINLFFSEHNFGANLPKKGAFGRPQAGGAQWSSAHYGMDVIVREPIQAPTGNHSIWPGNWAELGAVYRTNNDLGANSWTASNFYSYSTGGSQNGWTLIGARLWVPPANDDAYNFVGMTAEAGYYIKASGRINDTDDVGAIISSIAASPTASRTLARGWNDVYFDTPISLPWGSGIAIGWKIGSGTYYIAGSVSNQAISAKDGSPFYLAGSAVSGEKRGEFTLNGANATWSFQDLHYGIDLIVKEP